MLRSMYCVPQTTDMSLFSKRGRKWGWKSTEMFETSGKVNKYEPGGLFVWLTRQAFGIWASVLRMRPSWQTRRTSLIVLTVELQENGKTMETKASVSLFFFYENNGVKKLSDIKGHRYAVLYRKEKPTKVIWLLKVIMQHTISVRKKTLLMGLWVMYCYFHISFTLNSTSFKLWKYFLLNITKFRYIY